MRNLMTMIVTVLMAFVTLAQTEFSGVLRIAPEWTHTKNNSYSTIREQFGNLLSQAHTTGTNANQMNAVVQINGSLTNKQEYVMDLTALTNSFGDVIHLWRVNFLSVQSASTTFGDMYLGSGSETPFYSMFGSTNDYAIIKPGGLLLFSAPGVAGYTVTNGFFHLANPGPSNVTYQIIIGGAQ